MSAEILDGGVRGTFLTLEDTADAVHRLEDEGVSPDDITIFSPIPTPHLEEKIERRKSPVRWMTLIGGFLGTCTGFALTYWTFFAWPLHVGGKPVSSFPVAVVIMFELTVLLGGLFSLAAIFVFSRIPAWGRKPGYHPRYSVDAFGIFVRSAGEEREKARDILDRAGAKEVENAGK